jgi:hypothetical protein
MVYIMILFISETKIYKNNQQRNALSQKYGYVSYPISKIRT